MKILKIIGLILVILIVIVVITGLALPKQVEFEKEITIEASLDEVYAKVADFNHFRNWSPWAKYDEQAKITVEGAPATVGSKYSWAGNKQVGVGYMEIVAIEPMQKIDIDLVFTEPWQSTSDVYYTFSGDTLQSTVVWGFAQAAPFPQNVMFKLFGMEKNLHADFDEGLNNLKTMVEKM